jgi:hypothetical protein
MKPEEIREKIAEKLQYHESFLEALDETNPGHYGVVDYDVFITPKNILVDIPERTYTFDKVDFSFKLKIGGSSDRDGYEQSFSRIASGSGDFDFLRNNTDIIIGENSVEIDNLNLYDVEPE